MNIYKICRVKPEEDSLDNIPDRDYWDTITAQSIEAAIKEYMVDYLMAYESYFAGDLYRFLVQDVDGQVKRVHASLSVAVSVDLNPSNDTLVKFS